MNALHEQFVSESRELVQQATDDLIAAEREGFSEERIDRVFRAFHTLKGSAGVVELPAMGLTLHAAEDLLAAIQAGRVGATGAVIDQALACLDQVSSWVDAFEVHMSLPPEAGNDARLMAAKLRALLAGQGAEHAAHMSGASSAADALPDWVHRLIEAERDKLQSVAGRVREFVAFSYEPVAGCFFDGDDPIALTQRVSELLAFHIEPRDALGALSEMDPYACNLRLQGISGGTRETLSGVFRLVPDQVRIVTVPSAAFSQLGEPIGAGDASSLVRAVLEEQVLVLRASHDREDQAGRIGAAARVATNAMRHLQNDEWAQKIARSGASAVAQSDPKPLLSAIEDLLGFLTPNLTASVQATTADPERESLDRAVSRLLRVDESKIDALIDLAGELLVMKSGFAHLAKSAEGAMNGPDLARAIRVQLDSMERLAAELHGSILQLRMVPMAQVFRSFPRLVRDLSQQLGKTVTLVTRGETTESDKTVVDLLFEPLMHLVRNALDHGVETPEQRRAAGKAPGATIVLQASREGDRLAVEVTDDGRGIDPAVVRRRAGERRLLSADELAALSDEQAIDFIFSAGFSTSAEVSDISGRGVGMDVVRSTIERIGGRVSLKSRVGSGTTVSLDLPINIAMLRIMVVEAGGQVFGIPMDAVSETVRLTPDRISRIKNNDGFVLHDRVVPICSLAELVHLPASDVSASEVRLVVVAEINGRVTALEVDAIRDRLEVVLKPMQGLLANTRGYAGTTLLGDGAVLLVLDLREILP